MQFTRLRLNGFKSFVDPTDLVISTGLTGVVGPNGCGKSNLLEALRWIMGENRPSQMRGSGMDDVIFAGSDTRPTRNSASVELVVDNSDRLAPAQFNSEDKLEVSRRITRDVGSAYKINGRDVRARDVQMLFADASTGAHSPALVRQGQISELINAKPKARRRVLEEAAGISGLYQRRHEAELKLNGAETNLARLADVLDQLSQRLSSLERQAGQARRYRTIAEDLRRAHAVLLYLRWRVVEDERLAAETQLTEATRATAQAEAAAVAAARVREEADGALPKLREEETIAAAVVQRLVMERDQIDEREERARAEIDELTARMRQLAMDIEREETLQRDAGDSIAALETEEAELATGADGEAEAQQEAADAARAAGEKLSEQETTLDRLTEEAARLAARASAAERRVEEATANAARLDTEIDRVRASSATLATEITAHEAGFDTLSAADIAARSGAEAAEAALEAAEVARAAAQETESEARAALSDTEGETSALTAEVQGLRRLLARESSTGGRLIDRIKVTAGHEAALGTALGEDLNADAVARIDVSGWVNLDDYPAPQPLPDGVRPLAEVVDAPPVMTRRLSQTGLVDQDAGDALQPLLKPGQRIVSIAGDLWRWDGFRIRAGDAPTAAALRLQQRNRLARLEESLGRAENLRDRASDAYDRAKHVLDQATIAEGAARTKRREADQASGDAARALSRAEAALAMEKSKLAALADSVTAREEERTAAASALLEAEAAIADLGDVTEARQAVEVQRGEVDLARTTMLGARARSDELRRVQIAREKRRTELQRELTMWRDRLDNAGGRIGDLTQRISEAKIRQTEIAKEPEALALRREKLAGEIDSAQIRRTGAADLLASAETALRTAEAAERDAERAASATREERARLEAVQEGLAARTREAVEEIRTELEIEPEALLETLDADPGKLPPVDSAEADVARLRRQREALGAVNLRAEQDAEEVRAERDGIEAEKTDLEAAITKLRRGIAELNREGRQRLIEAFESVNKRFAELFRKLFNGGEARLVMVESDDPLDAGLEILCQPPGKKLSTLSLLSGGEQTLTALSLIFAVFLSNPAPICVLDEVDAPLDDSNVTRFCDLLDEMRRLTETRFLIITHHAITMSRMDRLFGVTMVERGISQLVSVDLQRASELVDA